MRTVSLPIERLIRFFQNRKMATMQQLKMVLGSEASMTVFRKLKQLDYISSCSHSGKYYTLKRIAKFDQRGLWIHRAVLFSSYGTLLETMRNIVEQSASGHTALELEKLLRVKPNESLLKLIDRKLIDRKKIAGNYVYLSTCRSVGIKQELSRNKLDGDSDLRKICPDVLMHELKAAIILFFSTLNEKQRRLYAGLESLKLGGAGKSVISELLGINKKTVSSGKQELLNNSLNVGTIRNPGGGRKKNK